MQWQNGTSELQVGGAWKLGTVRVARISESMHVMESDYYS